MWRRGESRADRAVAAVSTAVFVQSAGAAAVLPLLPLFLRREHTSVSLVGVVMASFFAAGVLTQYAAGHLSDRVGHRRVMVGGLVVYAAASLAFVASVGAGGYIVLRGLQGLGAGALQLAGLALVGAVVPLEQRGRAFSRVMAAQLSGMAIGPVAGAAVGVSRMPWLFTVSGALAIAAMLPVLRGVQPVPVAAAQDDQSRLRLSRGLVGVVMVGVIGGLCAGVYEACWSLLMTTRGAAQWQVGLSWTMFAVSFAAFSPMAGRLTDRVDRRALAVTGAATSAGFLAAYPFIPSTWLLIALGAVEAVGVAVAIPAAQSLLSQLVPAGALGRAQGLFTTAESATIAAVSAVSGYLFTVHRSLPFVATAVLAAALTALLPSQWREVTGRAGDAAGEHAVTALSSVRQRTPAVADMTANA